MTVVGESKACTRAVTWSLRRASSCSREDRRDKVEARDDGASAIESRRGRPGRRRAGARRRPHHRRY
eukprot:2195535-Pleurochrysis_carterae.AAC.1